MSEFSFLSENAFTLQLWSVWCLVVCATYCFASLTHSIWLSDLAAAEQSVLSEKHAQFTATFLCEAGGWAGGFSSICHFDRLFTLTKDRKPSELRLFWSMNCCQLTRSYCTVCACVQQLIINTFQLSWHHKNRVWSCLECNFFHYCFIWAWYLASLNPDYRVMTIIHGLNKCIKITALLIA